MISNKQQGTIIIWVMLFLVIIAALVMSSLEIGLLESKMADNFAAKNSSFNAANNLLLQYEAKVAAGVAIPEALLIAKGICGSDIYRIDALATNGTTKIQLESTFAKLNAVSDCEAKSRIVPGRQSWRMCDY